MWKMVESCVDRGGAVSQGEEFNNQSNNSNRQQTSLLFVVVMMAVSLWKARKHSGQAQQTVKSLL